MSKTKIVKMKRRPGPGRRKEQDPRTAKEIQRQNQQRRRAEYLREVGRIEGE